MLWSVVLSCLVLWQTGVGPICRTLNQGVNSGRQLYYAVKTGTLSIRNNQNQETGKLVIGNRSMEETHSYQEHEVHREKTKQHWTTQQQAEETKELKYTVE